MLPNANEICRGFRNRGLDRLVGKMIPRLRQLWGCVISEESGFEAPQAEAVSFQWPVPWSSPWIVPPGEPVREEGLRGEGGPRQ